MHPRQQASQRYQRIDILIALAYILYDYFIIYGHRGLMPRAFTVLERTKIRERLINAGKNFINRAGMRLLVVDDIAREAGISKGSFYSFFPSREDFILSVFETWEKEYRSSLLADIVEGVGSPRERLERFFLEAFALIEREPGLARLGMGEIMQIMEGLPPERMAAHKEADSRAMQAAISAWVEKGIVSAEDVPALGGILASLFAIAIHRKDYPEGSYEPAIRLIAEGLAMRLSR
jgi:AcrR family transcriptional regulator